jgi:hypothetical protein
MNKTSQRLTQADEEKLIAFQIYQVRKKLFALNKDLKFYQFTRIDIIHSEVMLAPTRLQHHLFGRIGDWWKQRKLRAIVEKNKEA